jgi:DNA repair protein RecO
MSYKTYTTRAIVCGTFNRNTADRSYLLFTREAGMIYADARSVREERSRQRCALQDFSLIRVSLVKGKRGWKIGSTESQKNYYHCSVDKAARGSVVGIYRLLRRFLKGEEPHVDLFEYVHNSLEVLAKEIQHRSFVEMVVRVHILGFLGYVDTRIIPKHLYYLDPIVISGNYAEEDSKKISRLYTQAVSVSHL